MTPPWCDCPPCPKCGGNGTRSSGFEAASYARSLGPRFLSCAERGHVWEASAEDVEKAAKADAAWEAQLEREREERAKRLGLRPGQRVPVSALAAEYGGTVARINADGSIEVASEEDLS